MVSKKMYLINRIIPCTILPVNIARASTACPTTKLTSKTGEGLPDHLAWLLKADKEVVVLVTGSGESTKKEMMTVSDVMCWITRQRGATEARVDDHDLTPKMKDKSPKVQKQYF